MSELLTMTEEQYRNAYHGVVDGRPDYEGSKAIELFYAEIQAQRAERDALRARAEQAEQQLEVCRASLDVATQTGLGHYRRAEQAEQTIQRVREFLKKRGNLNDKDAFDVADDVSVLLAPPTGGETS